MSIPHNRLKEFREKSKLTQAELGKLIDRDFTTVNKHENHQKPIPKELAQSYAQVFKIETVELFHNVTPEGDIIQ